MSRTPVDAMTPGPVGRRQGWRPWIGPLVVALAFAVGLATDALGTGRRVNLLAAPMLGVLAWNLAVYLWMLARSAASVLRRRSVAPAPGPLGRAMLRASRTANSLGVDGPADAARAAQALHAAAAAFAGGMLSGLYLRGLAFEYLAGWESTFLGAEGVHALLAVVHGPASALTGIALPDAGTLGSLQFGAGPGENAARWIHLHAATVLLYVILPRTLLALRAGRSARRLGRHARSGLPATGAHPDRPGTDARSPAADDAPFTGLAPGPDGRVRVRALPYSFTLGPAAQHGLAALLAADLGPAASLELAPSLSPESAESAATAPGADAQAPAPQLLLALFTLTATPEPQTHAAFVTALATRLTSETVLRVLIDESAFRARFAAAPQRLAQRRQAWRAVMNEIGIAPRFAALEGLAPATEARQ